jgi:ClpP class serine protease
MKTGQSKIEIRAEHTVCRLNSFLSVFANLLRFVFWLVLTVVILLSLVNFLLPAPQDKRQQALETTQEKRNSRAITLLIHRKEIISILGIPVRDYIDIDDAEAVLRIIRRTPAEKPIDLIVHTPGGLVLAASQIAQALSRHEGKVTVFIPHYAMSGGTLIALAADEIIMDPNAVLGPLDPQIGLLPAASIIKAAELKPVEEV